MLSTYSEEIAESQFNLLKSKHKRQCNIEMKLRVLEAQCPWFDSRLCSLTAGALLSVP